MAGHSTGRGRLRTYYYWKEKEADTKNDDDNDHHLSRHCRGIFVPGNSVHHAFLPSRTLPDSHFLVGNTKKQPKNLFKKGSKNFLGRFV